MKNADLLIAVNTVWVVIAAVLLFTVYVYGVNVELQRKLVKVTEAAFSAERRAPLTKERVLRAAVDLADRDGIDALSMRKLGQELGVEAMALYRHVRNKDDILDGAIDVVVGEIDIPRPTGDWQRSMRTLALAARQVMLRHPWAPPVIVERPEIGPSTLRHINAVMEILRGGPVTSNRRAGCQGRTSRFLSRMPTHRQ